tara:strand:- start:34 stop:681 length:648 start_codon:yes stop_codon:yes gene_type:complete
MLSGMDVKVSAVMTTGRYEAVFARNAIEKALRSLGIGLVTSQGVFYGQCMQRMFEDVQKIGADIILTIDGDSVFTAEHVKRLLNIIVQEDKIDALASLQVRRGKPDVLGFHKDKTSIEWSGYPVEVTSAHFGLTAIKVAKLKAVKKPWFFSQPDENGEWGDNRIDDDIWFWNQWQNAGNTLFLDAGCRIGHLEEMVASFAEDLTPIHVYPGDWQT